MMVSASVNAPDCCVASQARTFASMGMGGAHPDVIAVEMPKDGSCPDIIGAHVFTFITLGSVSHGGIGVLQVEESIVCHGPIGGALSWALVASRCACRHMMALPIPCRYSFTSCVFLVVVCHHGGACTTSGVHVGSHGVAPSGVHSEWLDWLELTLTGGGAC